MKKYFTLALLPISMVLLLGCSGYGSTPATTQTTSQPVSANSVSIANFSFSPLAINIKAGTTVTWTNKDSTIHTVTSNDNLFNGSVSPGATFSFTFNQVGTFQYHCNIHPSMTGSVVVGQ